MGVYLSGLSDSGEEAVGFGHQSVEEEKIGCLLLR